MPMEHKTAYLPIAGEHKITGWTCSMATVWVLQSLTKPVCAFTLIASFSVDAVMAADAQ